MTPKPYRVRLLLDVQKAVKRFPKKERLKIEEAMSALGENPRPGGCKKLGGKVYRIRVGRSYRIIYEVDDANRVITITDAATREGIY